MATTAGLFKTMNHLDLFSGIGGFALAAQWAFGQNHRIISFVEKDKYCQAVLKKHWPAAAIHDNIRNFDAKKLTTVELVTGGFPCQPFSVAGKQAGTKDDRYLWPEMLRVIKECRPRWVVGENVTGIISLALDEVLASLESEGYEAQTLIIPACAVDAPHRRDRVWIIAYADCERKPDFSIDAKTPGELGQFGNATNDNRINGNLSGLRRTGIPQLKAPGTRKDTFANSNDKRCEKHDSSEFAEKQGFIPRTPFENGTNWPTESGVCRVANGIPKRVDRIRALGNAIVPQVAFEIFAAIKRIDEL